MDGFEENEPEISEDQNLSEPYSGQPSSDENPTDMEEEISEISQLLCDDLNHLKSCFGELKNISDISELPNPIRYSALRDLGLTPEEAYLATSQRTRGDNRTHLKAAVPGASRAPYGSMTKREWNIARALFEDISDSEIERLYKRVTR